jgi:soluble lytic murein transglycosylase-like protein
MQSHPRDADEPTRPHHSDAGDGPHPDHPAPSDDALDALPAPLRNWQVIEIEGEATVVRDADNAAPRAESIAVGAPRLLQDHIDGTVVAGLSATQLQVSPGETATLNVTLLNNGRWPSLFEVTLEGWIDERWCPDLPARVHVQPGERQSVAVAITPSAPTGHLALGAATAAAGEHAAAVVVHAARYPGHVTRLALTLTIAPQVNVQVGTLEPRHSRAGWFQPVALVQVPLANQGNTQTTVQLSVRDRDHTCDFTFYPEPFGASVAEEAEPFARRSRVTLAPGAATAVAVEIRPRARPIVGLMTAPLPYRVTVQPLTPPGPRQIAEGRLSVLPLIGLWQMVAAAVVGVAVLFGVGLAGLALLVALRPTPAQVAAPVAAPAAAPVAPVAPVVAFVIQLGEQAPARPPQMVVTEPTATPPSGVPIVTVDQVTAPGEPVPAGQSRLQPIPPTPVPAAADAATRPLTYAEMFREIAARFDLDWRMLAAQAYVESGFDAVALGSRGDMGLMQILPNTWREWAPAVEASDPFDGYSNVLVAAAYLDHLRTQMSDRGYLQTEWMLVAYNWGPDQTLDFLAAGGSWETLDAERRQYAEEIVRIAASIPAN